MAKLDANAVKGAATTVAKKMTRQEQAREAFIQQMKARGIEPGKSKFADLAKQIKANEQKSQIEHKIKTDALKLKSREMRKETTRARNEAKKLGKPFEPKQEFPMDRFNRMPTTRIVDGQKVRWPKKERWAQFLKDEAERKKQGLI